jgi:hypothetical protein
MRALLKTALILAVATGCNDGDDAVFDTSRGAQSKPQPARDLDSFKAAGESGETSFVEASYDLKIFTRSGAKLCNGEADLKIGSKNGNIGLEFPTAQVKCLGITLDLAKMLKFGAQQTQEEPSVSSDGRVLRLDKIGGGTFNPPRPLVLGPVVQDPSKFEGFSESKNYTVSGTGQSGAFSGEGTIDLEVLGVNDKYEDGDIQFENVLHWQMTTKGFDKLPKASLFLFDKLEMYFNTRPIMIPKIVIEGELSDFMSGGPAAGGAAGGGIIGKVGDAFIGSLKIEFSVKNYKKS